MSYEERFAHMAMSECPYCANSWNHPTCNYNGAVTDERSRIAAKVRELYEREELTGTRPVSEAYQHVLAIIEEDEE